MKVTVTMIVVAMLAAGALLAIAVYRLNMVSCVAASVALLACMPIAYAEDRANEVSAAVAAVERQFGVVAADVSSAPELLQVRLGEQRGVQWLDNASPMVLVWCSATADMQRLVCYRDRDESLPPIALVSRSTP